MSPEEEFKSWLGRKDKSFGENFAFAINAWNSVEFHLQTKYEIVFQWFCDSIDAITLKNDRIDWDLLKKFAALRCPNGAISTEVTARYFQAILSYINSVGEMEKDRRPVEVLEILSNHPTSQSYYKANVNVYCQLLGVIFQQYKSYIQNLSDFVVSFEREFIDKVLLNVKDFIKRLPDVDGFRKYFTKRVIQPLCEMFVVIKAKNLQYFDDILDIFKLTYFVNSDDFGMLTHKQLSLHVRLQYLDFSLAHHRSSLEHLKSVLQMTFDWLPSSDISSDKTILLMAIRYILNLFRKYDIQVNLNIAENKTAMIFLHEKITALVLENYQDHLKEVLAMLCSTIKLNPMILEQNIFQITTKCLLSPKDDEDWIQYEEYMLLVMDMFRKLSRSEKLISQLLKSIKEHLENMKLTKKLKRKSLALDSTGTAKKLKLSSGKESHLTKSDQVVSKYFYLQLQEFNDCTPKQPNCESNESFKHISYAWPSDSVGKAFSKFISGLMSKPSFVIWKTLVYFLSGCIESLKSGTSDENLLFLIDFGSSLLCQYFTGSKLADQSDKYWKEIEANRILTRNVLREFGKALLSFEHNKRTMNAFLEICYSEGNFNLISWYYCPDFITSKEINFDLEAENIHNYLSADEWTLIEQRVINFGKINCKKNMNRLHLQRTKARILFSDAKNIDFNLRQALLSSTLEEFDQIVAIFGDKTNSWLVDRLTNDQIGMICGSIINHLDLVDFQIFAPILENKRFFEIFILSVFHGISNAFDSKKSILKSLNFKDILKKKKDCLVDVITAVNSSFEQHSIKKYLSGPIEKALALLASLPIGFCDVETKFLIFSLNLALYKDVLTTKNIELAQSCFDLFTNLLHFGEPIEIFQYFDIENLLNVFPPMTCPQIYEFIFNSLRKVSDATEKCLAKVIDLIKASNLNLTDDLIKLSMIVVVSFTQQNLLRKVKKYNQEIVELMSEHINRYFENKDRKLEDDKEFVLTTLPAYTFYINPILGKAKNDSDISEQFREICKIYIGHSINFKNQYAVKLINTALLYRVVLHFDPDEIQFVLNKYFNQFIETVKEEDQHLTNTDAVLKLILDYKSDNDFRKTLLELEENLNQDNAVYACKIVSRIARCQLNSVKGAIFNEYLKKILFKITLQRKLGGLEQFEDINIIINILNSYRAICENKQIAVSLQVVDDILSYLMDINIKKYEVSDQNSSNFQTLHSSMTDVCLALIKHRHIIVADRIPQFMCVFKDLLQAVCWYKSNRQKDATLDKVEVEEIAELAHKLEILMQHLAAHSIDVKRVAPYLLTHTIGLMVNNNRATTLYPKIKTHIENVCYDLISACDHRVGSFILRCSSDATKQVYESLCKEYKKYRKFKGKV